MRLPFRATTFGALAIAVTIGLLPSPASAADPVDKARRTAAAVAADITDAQQNADQAAAAWDQANAAYDEATTDVADAGTAREELVASLSSMADGVRSVALRRFVNDATVVGLPNSGTNDRDDAAHASALAAIVINSTNDQLDTYRARRKDLERATVALEAKQAKAKSLLTKVAGSQRALEGQLARLTTLRTAALNDVAVQTELARIRQAETAKQQAAALKAAQEAAAQRAAQPAAPQRAAQPARSRSVSPTPPGPGPRPAPPRTGLRCPVDGPTAFIDTFGAARDGIAGGHQGVDMMGSLNDPIVAPEAGTVTDRRFGSLGGNQMFFSGASGTSYFFAHLNSYGAAGSVAAGTVIGYMGSTGATSAVHLHFEIHPGHGRAINPYPTLRAIC